MQKSTFSQGERTRFLVKNDKILKSAFFTPLCPLGCRCVVKLPLGSFLGGNNALTKNGKNFLFCLYSVSIFPGQFFLSIVPWETQETSSDILILLEAFKGIFVFPPKIDYLPRGMPAVFGQK